MSGRHSFGELTKHFTPEHRVRVVAHKARLGVAIPLHELLQARAMTQEAVGEVLKVDRLSVARRERRVDTYVASLRTCIKARGGR